jgi:hypothetical protein
MIDLVFTREVVISLAVLGAVLSVLASVLQSRRGEGTLVTALVWTGYGFMGVSMALFAAIGLLGLGQGQA